MTIAILALQGAFLEHEKMLEQLGVNYIELRQSDDLKKQFDGLILPGGESTVQGKLLKELGMFEPLKQKIKDGLPVLATCAGMILLSETIENQADSKEASNGYFQTLPVTVLRNAYGRQLGSFYTENTFADKGTIPMTFIRAPYIKTARKDVTILATVDEKIVAVRYQNQLALSFHPELNSDVTIHQMFIDMVSEQN